MGGERGLVGLAPSEAEVESYSLASHRVLCRQAHSTCNVRTLEIVYSHASDPCNPLLISLA